MRPQKKNKRKTSRLLKKRLAENEYFSDEEPYRAPKEETTQEKLRVKFVGNSVAIEDLQVQNMRRIKEEKRALRALQMKEENIVEGIKVSFGQMNVEDVDIGKRNSQVIVISDSEEENANMESEDESLPQTEKDDDDDDKTSLFSASSDIDGSVKEQWNASEKDESSYDQTSGSMKPCVEIKEDIFEEVEASFKSKTFKKCSTCELETSPCHLCLAPGNPGDGEACGQGMHEGRGLKVLIDAANHIEDNDKSKKTKGEDAILIESLDALGKKGETSTAETTSSHAEACAGEKEIELAPCGEEEMQIQRADVSHNGRINEQSKVAGIDGQDILSRVTMHNRRRLNDIKEVEEIEKLEKDIQMNDNTVFVLTKKNRDQQEKGAQIMVSEMATVVKKTPIRDVEKWKRRKLEILMRRKDRISNSLGVFNILPKLLYKLGAGQDEQSLVYTPKYCREVNMEEYLGIACSDNATIILRNIAMGLMAAMREDHDFFPMIQGFNSYLTFKQLGAAHDGQMQAIAEAIGFDLPINHSSLEDGQAMYFACSLFNLAVIGQSEIVRLRQTFM